MDSLISTMRGLVLRVRFIGPRIRAMACRSVASGPPPSSEAWRQEAVVRELGAAYATWALKPPYWSGPVSTALLSAALLAMFALAAYFDVLPVDSWFAVSRAALWAAAISGTLAILAAAHALKRHGPDEAITHGAFDATKERLLVSTDDCVKPLSFPKVMLLVAILLLDGAILGSAMSRSLGAFLTPKWAMVVTLLWGAGSATLLWKLSKLAAREHRQNQVRAAIRRLDGSPRAEDQLRARKFIDTVGSRIDFNLEAGAPIRKRVVLFVVSLALALASIGLRVFNGEQAGQGPVATDGGPIEIPPPFASVDEKTDAPTFGTPSSPQFIWISAAVLSLVVLASVTVLYWQLAGAECVDETNSPSDLAVVQRFKGTYEIDQYHRFHLQKVISELGGRLNCLVEAIDREKKRLAPSEARKWPNLNVSAADVLRDALAQSHFTPNDPTPASTNLLRTE